MSAGRHAYPGGMKQPPFPFALVLLTGFLAWIAVSTDGGWVPWAAGFGALFTTAAALYQSRPVREPAEPADDVLEMPRDARDDPRDDQPGGRP